MLTLNNIDNLTPYTVPDEIWDGYRRPSTQRKLIVNKTLNICVKLSLDEAT